MLIEEAENNKISCPYCSSRFKYEVKKSTTFAYCSNEDCKAIWMVAKDPKNKILLAECYEKKFLFEFFVELPFNLGLPTGFYSFDKPKQIMIRRDMYYFQKGNELENLRTFQPIYAGQEGAFNEFGIFKTEFEDFKYKRKMKSIFLKKIPVSGIFRKGIEIRKILESDIIKGVLFQTQVHFQKIINEFLMYYALYFPENNMIGQFQHDVRPISIYEFSKYLFNCAAIIDGVRYDILPITQDFTNLKGIPDITYSNSNKKIDEFERILQNRSQIPIMSHQQLFILARSLFRTNKDFMGSVIITTAMNAYESLLNILERTHPHFIALKKFRKRIFKENSELRKPGKYKKSFAFLEFYTDYAIFSITRLIKKNNFSDFKKFIIILNHLRNINVARSIRNDIVHGGQFDCEVNIDYTLKEGFTNQYTIKFYNKKTRNQDKIDFNELWKSFLIIYDILNKILMKNLYESFKWGIKSEFKKEIIAISVEKAKSIVKIVPNINWREINSYEFDLKAPSVPPDLFLIEFETLDGKKFILNDDKEYKRLERFDEPISIPGKTYSKDIKKLWKKNKLTIPIMNHGRVYVFSSCLKCGFLIPIHNHHRLKNNRCPKCSNEFNLINIWTSSALTFFNNEEYEIAIPFFEKILEINPLHQATLNNLGSCYIGLKKFEKANSSLNQIKLDNLDDKTKTIVLCHLGICLYELGHKNEAMEKIELALKIDPVNKFAIHNLCRILISEKKLIEADIKVMKLINIDKNYAHAYFFKARIESLREKPDKAITFLKQAIKLDFKIKKFITETPDFNNLKLIEEFKELIHDKNPKYKLK